MLQRYTDSGLHAKCPRPGAFVSQPELRLHSPGRNGAHPLFAGGPSPAIGVQSVWERSQGKGRWRISARYPGALQCQLEIHFMPVVPKSQNVREFCKELMVACGK